VLGVVTIVAVNYLLKRTTHLLSSFEKHPSVTAMQESMTWKLFVGLFINTSIVLLVVNADLQVYLGVNLIFNGTYQDFVYTVRRNTMNNTQHTTHNTQQQQQHITTTTTHNNNNNT
jgi:hypothetical protein